MAKEITKKMVLEAIIKWVDEDPDYVIKLDDDVYVGGCDIQDYARLTIAQLDAKNEKAKERAAKKKAEGDALLDAVKDALTDEYQTGAEIFAAVADIEGATQAKVTARLTKLVKAEIAHKTDQKVDGRKIKVYALGAEPAVETDEDEAADEE